MVADNKISAVVQIVQRAVLLAAAGPYKSMDDQQSSFAVEREPVQIVRLHLDSTVVCRTVEVLRFVPCTLELADWAWKIRSSIASANRRFEEVDAAVDVLEVVVVAVPLLKKTMIHRPTAHYWMLLSFSVSNLGN